MGLQSGCHVSLFLFGLTGTCVETSVMTHGKWQSLMLVWLPVGIHVCLHSQRISFDAGYLQSAECPMFADPLHGCGVLAKSASALHPP